MRIIIYLLKLIRGTEPLHKYNKEFIKKIENEHFTSYMNNKEFKTGIAAYEHSVNYKKIH